MARWNVGLCGSEPAILNSAAKRFKTQCFSTTPRVYSVFFAFMGLDFDPCPSPCPWPPGVQKEKTVTIRGQLYGTNTGTSAPLTAPFFGRFWGRHRDQRSQLCNSGSCRLPRSWSLQSLTLEDKIQKFIEDELHRCSFDGDVRIVRYTRTPANKAGNQSH